MNSFYGKIFQNILIWIAITNLVLISVVVIADNDFDRSTSSKAQESYGYIIPSNIYVTKKLSEFLGGPGRKRSDEESYYQLTKRLSEFLGGPGRKKSDPTNVVVDKKLSEFLGGPGK